MEDELSGALTLAFDLLEVSEDSLDATFDSRCPICANEENVLEPARRRLAEHGFTLTNETMTPPHYVDGNSDFVKTLLRHMRDIQAVREPVNRWAEEPMYTV